MKVITDFESLVKLKQEIFKGIRSELFDVLTKNVVCKKLKQNAKSKEEKDTYQKRLEKFKEQVAKLRHSMEFYDMRFKDMTKELFSKGRVTISMKQSTFEKLMEQEKRWVNLSFSNITEQEALDIISKDFEILDEEIKDVEEQIDEALKE